MRLSAAVLLLIVPVLGHAGRRGLLNPACPLLDPVVSFSRDGLIPPAARRPEKYQWTKKGKTYVVSVDFYPHEEGQLLTRLVRVQEAPPEEASSLPKISSKILMEWIDPNLQFTDKEYKERRIWTENFRKKLG